MLVYEYYADVLALCREPIKGRLNIRSFGLAVNY